MNSLSVHNDRKSWLTLLPLGLLVIAFISGCSVLRAFRLPALGVAGKYRVGKAFLMKPRETGVNEAVPYLEEVAQKSPSYEDVLTLLGRAYYRQGRYQDTLLMLQRALAVDNEDEIAWLVLGLTQLRLGDDQAGFENLKIGLGLLRKVSKDGYRGYTRWDLNRLVRKAIQKAIFQVRKEGMVVKESLIISGDLILSRLNDEEASQLQDERVIGAISEDIPDYIK